jgi:hypothetical protein
MKPFSLTFKAGAGALKSVRQHGFDLASIGTIAGASGGAKWLVLSQLDRAILRSVVPHVGGPVHLIGSSIGSWRFACYAQADPTAAIERFEKAYLEQSYSEKPDIHEITAKSREILSIVLGDTGVAEILNNPLFRTHIMAVRSRHILASENSAILALGLITAASLNAVSRSTLGWSFERALFYDEREIPPFFDVTGFPLQRVKLTPDNLQDAIVLTITWTCRTARASDLPSFRIFMGGLSPAGSTRNWPGGGRKRATWTGPYSSARPMSSWRNYPMARSRTGRIL